VVARLDANPSVIWQFACPICQAALLSSSPYTNAAPDRGDPPWSPAPSHTDASRSPTMPEGNGFARCEGCCRTFQYSSGIWRFLPEQRAERFEGFLREYQIVRTHEGWGTSHAAYYHRLPSVDRNDPQREIWRIRAKSFASLLDRVVQPREAQLGRPMTILDLGAGNCWLSYRLAERGHQVAAVDVSTSAADGLGAHVWYGPAVRFTPVQAEFDHLPFSAEQADLVLFNASLHYSADCAVTLTEARRVLRPDGRVVIMDSPVYDDATSGEQMVHERQSEYERKYGFRSDALRSESFLTMARLDELAAAVGIRWDIHTPFYGVGWLLRPWRARLRGHRQPARMPLIVGRLLSGKASAAGAGPYATV